MCPICEHLKRKCFRCSTRHLIEINDWLDYASLFERVEEVVRNGVRKPKQTNPYFDRDDWEPRVSVPGKVMEN
mgnify:CR=1 FL=1